jgi:hypothetical protein
MIMQTRERERERERGQVGGSDQTQEETHTQEVKHLVFEKKKTSDKKISEFGAGQRR